MDGNQFDNGFANIQVPKGFEAVGDSLPSSNVANPVVTSFSTNNSMLGNTGEKSYKCGKCGTMFSTFENMVLACPYCGDKNIITTVAAPVYTSFVIPFTLTRNDAYNAYKKKLNNPFAPNVFHEKNLYQKIQKLYIPCDLYDMKVGGSITFIGADRYNKSSNLQSYEVLYTTNFDYNNVFVSNYSKIGNDIISNLNFISYGELKSYSKDIIGDAYIVNNNDNSDETFTKIKDKVMKHSVNIVRQTIKHQLKKVGSNNMNVGISSSQKVLVPIYLLQVKYQGKKYYFYMNGNKGYSILNSVCSVLKIVLASLILFLIIFGILTLLSMVL